MSEVYGNTSVWQLAQASFLRQLAAHMFPGIRLWLAVASILFMDGLWLLLNERLSADPLLMAQCAAGFVFAMTVAMAAAFRNGNDDDLSLAHAISMTAFFALAAWPALLIFNHLVMSVKMPFTDDLLIAADRAVGFQWLSYAEFIARHPWLTVAMSLAYHGIHAAVAVCFILHLFMRKNAHAREFAGLLLVTGIAGSLIGIFFPALAAMTLLGTVELTQQLPPLAGRVFVEPLLAMRSADVLTFTHANLTGVTALPSYHVTLGALCVYACRGAWWMLLPMAAYVALMIASTPIFGGHYLTDIVSGIAFTGVMIWAWRSYLAAWLAPEPMRFHASRPAIL